MGNVNSRYSQVIARPLPHQRLGTVVGLEFRLPLAAAAAAAKPYQVVPGDTLDRISHACYGSTLLWHAIAERNPTTFWPLDPFDSTVIAIPPLPVALGQPS